MRKLWIGLIYLPHLTQAFCAVVELWCSHPHAPVQLLQQEATYTFHYLKIREIDQDLWGYWNMLRYIDSGICERSRFLPHFTSASMRYCSPSLCRNFLTETSLSLTPCCLLKWKLWHRIRCTTSILQQIRTIKIQAKHDCVYKSKKLCTLRRFFFSHSFNGTNKRSIPFRRVCPFRATVESWRESGVDINGYILILKQTKWTRLVWYVLNPKKHAYV